MIPLRLTPAHRKELEVDSSITEAAIEERGYFTAETKEELLSIGFSDAQALAPALVIPLCGVDGLGVGYQIKPDTPRMRRGKPVKYETPAGWQMRLDVPRSQLRHILDPKTPLWITEGVKKADAAAVRGLCCISLMGVWNWRGKNDLGGVTELSDWDKIALRGRKVYIAFDSDVMTKQEVQLALRRLAKMLKRRGAAEVLPAIPFLLGVETKLGLDDYFAQGGTSQGLVDSVDKSLIEERRIVANNRQLHEITNDAIAALIESNIPPTTFVRGGELVRVVIDERGIPKIQATSPASVRGIVARSASWVRVTKDGTTEIAPPKEVVEDLMALGEWQHIPPIVAITKAPVLAASGVLSKAPGYCPDSRFYIASNTTWPAWEGDVQSAVDFIFNDMLADFPFADQASKAHALGLMLLNIVRPAIDGQTPLNLIDAPVQGSGKSLLARVCMMPTAGNEVSGTPGSKDDEEWRKKITSCLLEGRSYIFFDNLTRKIDFSSLDAALTQPEWFDRALQQSRIITIPIRCVWIATANNAELSKDILRRTVWIRIDPNIERPEDREAFKHPKIEEWVKENRATIVSALIAIVEHWLDAGQPSFKGRLLGSFEEWSSVIGGILESVGVSGFLGNIEELRSTANTDHAAWCAFLERWHQNFTDNPVKASDIKETFDIDEELAGTLGSAGDATRVTRLGFALKRNVGVVYGGYKIVRHVGKSTNSTRYQVVLVEDTNPDKIAQPRQTPIDENEPKNRGYRGYRGFPDLPRAHTHAREDLPHGECSQNPDNPDNPDKNGDDEAVIV